MGFTDIVEPREDGSNKNQIEISRIKEQFEKEDRIFGKELPLEYGLLVKFNLDELRKLCCDLLGTGLLPDYHIDSDSGTSVELPQYKEDYIHFIIDELALPEIKEYALRH